MEYANEFDYIIYTRKHKYKCEKIQISIPPTLNNAHFF